MLTKVPILSTPTAWATLSGHSDGRQHIIAMTVLGDAPDESDGQSHSTRNRASHSHESRYPVSQTHANNDRVPQQLSVVEEANAAMSDPRTAHTVLSLLPSSVAVCAPVLCTREGVVEVDGRGALDELQQHRSSTLSFAASAAATIPLLMQSATTSQGGLLACGVCYSSFTSPPNMSPSSTSRLSSAGDGMSSYWMCELVYLSGQQCVARMPMRVSESICRVLCTRGGHDTDESAAVGVGATDEGAAATAARSTMSARTVPPPSPPRPTPSSSHHTEMSLTSAEYATRFPMLCFELPLVNSLAAATPEMTDTTTNTTGMQKTVLTVMRTGPSTLLVCDAHRQQAVMLTLDVPEGVSMVCMAAGPTLPLQQQQQQQQHENNRRGELDNSSSNVGGAVQVTVLLSDNTIVLCGCISHPPPTSANPGSRSRTPIQRDNSNADGISVRDGSNAHDCTHSGDTSAAAASRSGLQHTANEEEEGSTTVQASVQMTHSAALHAHSLSWSFDVLAAFQVSLPHVQPEDGSAQSQKPSTAAAWSAHRMAWSGENVLWIVYNGGRVAALRLPSAPCCNAILSRASDGTSTVPPDDSGHHAALVQHRIWTHPNSAITSSSSSSVPTSGSSSNASFLVMLEQMVYVTLPTLARSQLPVRHYRPKQRICQASASIGAAGVVTEKVSVQWHVRADPHVARLHLCCTDTDAPAEVTYGYVQCATSPFRAYSSSDTPASSSALQYASQEPIAAPRADSAILTRLHRIAYDGEVVYGFDIVACGRWLHYTLLTQRCGGEGGLVELTLPAQCIALPPYIANAATHNYTEHDDNNNSGKSSICDRTRNSTQVGMRHLARVIATASETMLGGYCAVCEQQLSDTATQLRSARGEADVARAQEQLTHTQHALYALRYRAHGRCGVNDMMGVGAHENSLPRLLLHRLAALCREATVYRLLFRVGAVRCVRPNADMHTDRDPSSHATPQENVDPNEATHDEESEDANWLQCPLARALQLQKARALVHDAHVALMTIVNNTFPSLLPSWKGDTSSTTSAVPDETVLWPTRSRLCVDHMLASLGYAGGATGGLSISQIVAHHVARGVTTELALLILYYSYNSADDRPHTVAAPHSHRALREDLLRMYNLPVSLNVWAYCAHAVDHGINPAEDGYCTSDDEERGDENNSSNSDSNGANDNIDEDAETMLSLRRAVHTLGTPPSPRDMFATLVLNLVAAGGLDAVFHLTGLLLALSTQQSCGTAVMLSRPERRDNNTSASQELHESLPVSVILRLFLVALHARARRVVELLYRALCVHDSVCTEAHAMATRALALAALQSGSVRPLRGLISVGSREEYMVERVLREHSLTHMSQKNNNNATNSSHNTNNNIVLLQFYVMMRRYDEALQLGTHMTARWGGQSGCNGPSATNKSMNSNGNDRHRRAASDGSEEADDEPPVSQSLLVHATSSAHGIRSTRSTNETDNSTVAASVYDWDGANAHEDGSAMRSIVAYLRSLQPALPRYPLVGGASQTRSLPSPLHTGDCTGYRCHSASALAIDTSAVMRQLEAVHRSCRPHQHHQRDHHDKYNTFTSTEPPRPSTISSSLGDGLPISALNAYRTQQTQDS